MGNPAFGIDARFVFLILVIIIGSYAIAFCIRNYRAINSYEYLIIGLMFFSQTFFALWRLYAFYIMRNPNLFEFFASLQGLNEYKADYTLYFLLEVPVQTIWSIGIICYLLHILHIFEWQKRSIPVKIMLSLVVLEGIGQAFYYSAHSIGVSIVQDEATLSAFYNTEPLFLKFWILHFFFEEVVALNVYLLILNLTLVMAYVFVKPVTETDAVKKGRVMWITFGAFGVLQWGVATLSWVYPDLAEINLLRYGEFALFSAFIVLALLLVYYPQSVLINKSIFYSAKKLYRYLESDTTKKPFYQPNPDFQIKTYLNNLPPELLEEVRDQGNLAEDLEK